MSDEIQATPEYKMVDVLDSQGNHLVTLTVSVDVELDDVMSIVMQTAAGLASIVEPKKAADDLSEDALNRYMQAAARGIMLALHLL